MKTGRKEVKIREKSKYTDRVFSYIMRNPQMELKALSIPINDSESELKVWHPDISETGFRRKLLTLIVFAFYQVENEEFDAMTGFRNSIQTVKDYEELNHRIETKTANK